jgi:FeS assembly SUF system regulator
MLRISKLTDYAVVLSTELASTTSPRSVTRLSASTGVPAPTTSKVLKSLTRAGIVESVRGKAGGYRLARGAGEISVAELIRAIEGPIAVTECADENDGHICSIQEDCGVRANWQVINRAVEDALEKVRLSDMTRSEQKLVSLFRSQGEAEQRRHTDEALEVQENG